MLAHDLLVFSTLLVTLVMLIVVLAGLFGGDYSLASPAYGLLRTVLSFMVVASSSFMALKKWQWHGDAIKEEPWHPVTLVYHLLVLGSLRRSVTFPLIA